MRDQIGAHEPTPAFRVALERDITRALRQESGALPSRRGKWSRLATAWPVAAALVVGVFVGAAPAQVQDSIQRGILVRSAEARVQMAELQLEMARTASQVAQERSNRGLTSRQALEVARAQLRTAEAKLMAERLNLEEVTRTARPARDEITAPLVGNRDFVAERMRLELSALQEQLAAAERQLAVVEQQLKVGVVATVAAQEARASVEDMRAAAEVLSGQLTLRSRYLTGGMQPEVAEREARIAQLSAELASAMRMKQLAMERLRLVQTQHRAGVATREELLKAELESLERESAIQQLQLQLQLLRSGGSSGSGFGAQRDTIR